MANLTGKEVIVKLKWGMEYKGNNSDDDYDDDDKDKSETDYDDDHIDYGCISDYDIDEFADYDAATVTCNCLVFVPWSNEMQRGMKLFLTVMCVEGILWWRTLNTK